MNQTMLWFLNHSMISFCDYNFPQKLKFWSSFSPSKFIGTIFFWRQTFRAVPHSKLLEDFKYSPTLYGSLLGCLWVLFDIWNLPIHSHYLIEKIYIILQNKFCVRKKPSNWFAMKREWVNNENLTLTIPLSQHTSLGCSFLLLNYIIVVVLIFCITSNSNIDK